jgi:TonB family protein
VTDVPVQRTPDQSREHARETRQIIIHGFLTFALVASVSQECASKPASFRAPVSRALAYQDASGAWNEDTAGVTLPVLKHRVSPGAPARSEQVSGAVAMKVLVTSNGAVDQVVVTKGLSRAMDHEALEAVRQWVYSPATRNGEPVAVWMTVTVTYHFNG